jgi:hypothetical protein
LSPHCLYPAGYCLGSGPICKSKGAVIVEATFLAVKDINVYN